LKIIALEEHMLPRDILESAGLSLGNPMKRRAKELDDLPARLQIMDDAGIDVQILSAVGQFIQELEPPTSIAVSRQVNDRMAKTVSDHPDRFRAFATLPMADPQGAVVEFRRAIEELGFVGAMIHGQTSGRFLDHPSFQPVLECAEEFGVPIYLHPGLPPSAVREAYFSGLEPPLATLLATGGWGWHAECGMHVLRMIVDGVFERHPALQLIVGHMGEGLPFSLIRADDVLTPMLKGHALSVAETAQRNLHITTSGYMSVAPLQCALAVFGVDRIMFSVDYPFSATDKAVDFLNQAPISPADRVKIASGNAQRLLRL
jgi:predicted TIM-barrel fold metal-dependent hydrolase